MSMWAVIFVYSMATYTHTDANIKLYALTIYFLLLAITIATTVLSKHVVTYSTYILTWTSIYICRIWKVYIKHGSVLNYCTPAKLTVIIVKICKGNTVDCITAGYCNGENWRFKFLPSNCLIDRFTKTIK